DRGSKKVQAYHLKQAIQMTEVFDFLKDIVLKIPNPLNRGMEEDSKRAVGGGLNLTNGNSDSIVFNQVSLKARDYEDEMLLDENGGGNDGFAQMGSR
ncbi:hypothetical protein BY996DRAFT_4574174, partial [Phakopsora pachyrhizi]